MKQTRRYDHGGRTDRQNTSSEQLTTKYHEVWPPITYVQVKCHITPEIVAFEIVPKSFDNMKHTERSPIKISLFYYDITYSLSTYDHRPSIHQHRSPELATIFK